MAKFTLQTPFSAVSGKIGGDTGVVGMKTRTQNVFRNMVIPANPNSPAQVAVRAAFTQASQGYSQLSDLQRDGWETLGDIITKTDSLDQDYTYFGNNAYLAVNSYRLLNGEALNNDAPGFFVTPAVELSSLSLSGTDLTINWNGGAAGQFGVVRISRALPGIRRGRPGDVVFPTNDPANSIVDLGPGTATITLERFAITGGDRIAISILSLATTYLFGQTLFVPSIDVVEI